MAHIAAARQTRYDTSTKCITTLEGDAMGRHKFWAIATTICMLMTLYTGYKHK